MPDLRGAGRQHRSDGEGGGLADPRDGRDAADRGGAVLTSLADRLRGIVTSVAPTRRADPTAPADAAPAPAGDAAEVLGGEWRTGFLTVERRYAPGHRHGRIAVADAAPPGEGWSQLPLLAGAPGLTGGQECLFLDLETTGLAGGAGTYAFLVGLGWFEHCSFRVRQFFLSSYAAERILLEAVATLARSAGTVVTFNGKSFDLPVLETRYVINRMETPFAGLPHVDMLHHARRLWRPAEVRGDDDSGPRRVERAAGTGEGGCRLTTLEHALCGHQREGDVPGFEIPARYFHYVRTGEARQLSAVLEHNRLDLLSLALLTARAAALLELGAAASQSPREALGIGQLYEKAGRIEEARAGFARAASWTGADPLTRAEALRALATQCRRARAYDEAASAWRTILSLRECPPSIVREAAEALAVHHEHRLRDPLAARSFALESLRLPGTATRRDAIRHRLARLDRKLGSEGTEAAAPLF